MLKSRCREGAHLDVRLSSKVRGRSSVGIFSRALGCSSCSSSRGRRIGASLRAGRRLLSVRREVVRDERSRGTRGRTTRAGQAGTCRRQYLVGRDGTVATRSGGRWGSRTRAELGNRRRKAEAAGSRCLSRVSSVVDRLGTLFLVLGRLRLLVDVRSAPDGDSLARPREGGRRKRDQLGLLFDRRRARCGPGQGDAVGHLCMVCLRIIRFELGRRGTGIDDDLGRRGKAVRFVRARLAVPCSRVSARRRNRPWAGVVTCNVRIVLSGRMRLGRRCFNRDRGSTTVYDDDLDGGESTYTPQMAEAGLRASGDELGKLATGE